MTHPVFRTLVPGVKPSASVTAEQTSLTKRKMKVKDRKLASCTCTIMLLSFSITYVSAPSWHEYPTRRYSDNTLVNIQVCFWSLSYVDRHNSWNLKRNQSFSRNFGLSPCTVHTFHLQADEPTHHQCLLSLQGVQIPMAGQKCVFCMS